MSQSPNLGLHITPESDNTKTFKLYRTEMSGDQSTSNMMKIDAALGDVMTNYLNRANHTGTQTASTISNFVTTVRNTVLTGLSFVSGVAITASDSILSAFGKLQTQITSLVSTVTSYGSTMSSHITNISNPHSTTIAQVGGSNNSLIINNDFRNGCIVNQRGQLIYTTQGYTIDMWKIIDNGGSMKVTVNPAGYITLNKTSTGYSSFVQPIDPSVISLLRNKTVTLSLWKYDLSEITSLTLTVPETGAIDTPEIDLGRGFRCDLIGDASNTYLHFRIYNNTTAEGMSFYAAKLEFGSVSTLANDPLANFSEQLALCQRYNLTINGTIKNAYSYIGVGNIINTTQIAVNIPLPVPLRMFPPSIYYRSMSDFVVSIAGVGDIVPSEVILGLVSEHSLDLVFTIPETSTENYAKSCRVYMYNADSLARLGLSAEL